MTRRTIPRRTAAAPRRSSAPQAPVAGEAPPAAPPSWRDPWLWLSVLGVLPLVLHSLGAPLGEAVAEDFDFIRHNVLLGRHSLLDGGGSHAFWRPVSHQLYYTLLGPLILEHPRVVAAIHVAVLALTAALLYRTLRRWWSGPAAAAAASFPFLTESVRTVVSWPSHGVELASLFFAVLALHEASRRRLATCVAALVLGLLSKEVLVVTALLIPFLPAAPGERGVPVRERARWAVAIGVAGAAWAACYLWVRHHAGLALPHDIESDPALLAVPLTRRLVWATWNSLRALMSMPAAASTTEVTRWTTLAAGLLVVAATAAACSTRAARARLRAALPWIAWGSVWFALASATLTTVYPFWMPNRALFGSVGLGIALTALLGAAWPVLPWALVALRLAAFAVSPGPSTAISIDPDRTGAFMDFEQLTRLQTLMTDTRHALTARYPTLPSGARIGQHAMPRRAEYAFGGDHALQCWYRDSTLRWVRFEEYSRDSAAGLTAIVEYQLGQSPGIALVDPAAMRELFGGIARIRDQDLPGALSAFAAAESLQRDRHAGVFLGTVAGKEAVCAMGLGRFDEAMAAGRRAITLYEEDADGRYVIAAIEAQRGNFDAAEAQVDTLIAISPHDRDALALRERIRAGRR